MQNEKTGIILMTYGSATTAEHVREYLKNIYKGKASEELIQDFENRYALVGGSPLIKITQQQAQLLQEKLNENDTADVAKATQYIVRAGMRHSAPHIAEAVAECKAAGAEHLIGIVMSPQFSSIIMDGYRASFMSAAQESGFKEDKITLVGPWPTESHFIELLAQRIKSSLVLFQKKHTEKNLGKYTNNIPIIFTTHSLPESVVKKDPNYLVQLRSTIDAVRAKLNEEGVALSEENTDWYSGYQSAGHTPEAWLKPDLTDILDEIARKDKMDTSKTGATLAALIVPIQFLTDHLEILYDLDIAAKKQCEERGIVYHRIELPNTDRLFIDVLANIVTPH